MAQKKKTANVGDDHKWSFECHRDDVWFARNTGHMLAVFWRRSVISRPPPKWESTRSVSWLHDMPMVWRVRRESLWNSVVSSSKLGTRTDRGSECLPVRQARYGPCITDDTGVGVRRPPSWKSRYRKEFQHTKRWFRLWSCLSVGTQQKFRLYNLWFLKFFMFVYLNLKLAKLV